MERIKRNLMMALIATFLCMSVPAISQDREANNKQERYDDDKDTNYGWIGLLGLVGLVGLIKKSRDARDTGYVSQPAKSY